MRCVLLCLFVVLASCETPEKEREQVKALQKQVETLKQEAAYQEPVAPLTIAAVERFLQDGNAMYVSVGLDPRLGLVHFVGHDAILYKRDGSDTSGLYRPIHTLSDIGRLPHISATEPQLAEMRGLLLPAFAETPAATSSTEQATPVGPGEVAVPDHFSTLEAENILGPHAGFVSTATQQNHGFYCVMNRQIYLYKWDDTTKTYRNFRGMADYRKMPGPIVISDAMLEEMRAELSTPPLAK